MVEPVSDGLHPEDANTKLECCLDFCDGSKEVSRLGQAGVKEENGAFLPRYGLSQKLRVGSAATYFPKGLPPQYRRR